MKKEIIASNGYIGIVDIIHDIDDRVKVLGITGKIHTLKLYYTLKDEDPYFILYGHRHHLKNFIRVDL